MLTLHIIVSVVASDLMSQLNNIYLVWTCFLLFYRKKRQVSFLLEDGGVYAVTALISYALGNQQVGEEFQKIKLLIQAVKAVISLIR